MSATPQVNLPITFVDRDPATPGSGTPFNAASMNPNFAELATKYNEHTHDEYALVTALTAHENLTQAVHGITDTANLVYTADPRLSDMRVPTDGSVTDAKVAANAAIAYTKLALAGQVKLTDLNFTPTTLTSSGTFFARSQASTSTLTLATRVTADTSDRFAILAGGMMQWGDGTLARDTTLYRSAAAMLKTDGGFRIGTGVYLGDVGTNQGIIYLQNNGYVAARYGTNTGSAAFVSRLGTDAADRFSLSHAGIMTWGDGTNAQDTTLQRTGVGALQLGTSSQAGSLMVMGASTGAALLRVRGLGTDTADRFSVQGSGLLNWGSGTAAADTNLYRSTVGVVKTDQSLTVGQVLVVGGATNLQSYTTINKIADPGVAPVNTGRLYVKDNGSGKMQLVFQAPTGTPIVLATEA